MVTIPAIWRDLAKWQRAAKDAEKRATEAAVLQDALGAASWLMLAARAHLRASEALEEASESLHAQVPKVKKSKAGCPTGDHDVILCNSVPNETTMEEILGDELV